MGACAKLVIYGRERTHMAFGSVGVFATFGSGGYGCGAKSAMVV